MSTDAGTSLAGRPRRLATSATVPRARGEGAPALAVVADGCVTTGSGRLVGLGAALGGSGVTARTRGTTLGRSAVGFVSVERGRVRGGSTTIGGRSRCPVSGSAGGGVVAGGAGAVGAGATCAYPGPPAQTRQVATIVDLSHRDRRTPGGSVLAEKL